MYGPGFDSEFPPKLLTHLTLKDKKKNCELTVSVLEIAGMPTYIP